MESKQERDQMRLFEAVKEGKTTALISMLEGGCFDANIRNQNQQTLLHVACEYGMLSIVEYLIENVKANVEAEDDVGQTPLFDACRSGHFNIVKYLIEISNAKIDALDHHMNTVMHILCENKKNLKIIQYLVEDKGINCEVQNEDGETPIFNASRYDQVEIVRYLLCHGADKYIVNTIDEYPCDVTNNDEIKRLLQVKF